MLAVDTNLVVRYLMTGENRAQSAKAVSVIEGGEVFVATTVLLETDWVLRAVYGFARRDVTAAFRQLAGMANIQVEDAARLALALNWVDEGFDFADALHLASAGDCDAFVTFDKSFVKAAKAMRTPEVRLP